MTEISAVRTCAQKVLCEGSGQWLWRRACRIALNIECILKLKPIAAAKLAVDNLGLVSAGYFVDSGLVCGRKKNKAIYFDIEPRELIELSATVAAERLATILTATKVAGICDTIIESSNKFTKNPEAMILSDAKNLDDLSLAGIMCEFRRFAAEAKDTQNFVANWKRKLDYHYWDARLKDDFRFTPVAKIAAKRFQTVKSFIQQLEETLIAGDIR